MDSSNRYKNAYLSLGSERKQSDIPIDNSVEIRKRRGRRAQIKKDNVADKFWRLRRDEEWVEVPKRVSVEKGIAKQVYLVNDILMAIAPTSTFNPRYVWENVKAAERAAALAKFAPKVKAEEVVIGRKADLIIERVNEAALAKEINSDTLKIRTKSQNLKDLKSLLPDIKQRRTREILLVEILSKALRETIVDYREVFDVLWAIESMGALTQEVAPKNSTSAVVLVYDNLKKVDDVISQAKKARAREQDLISFQLNEMSSRLPPLSQYWVGGLKLDPWQRQVLEFIDAGKSVVVCAPTSSGKTVLSSYVALIDKRRQSGAAVDVNQSQSSSKAAAAEEEYSEEVDIDGIEADGPEDEGEAVGEEEDEGEEEFEEVNVRFEQHGIESAQDFEGEDEDLASNKISVNAPSSNQSAQANQLEHFSLIYNNAKAGRLLMNHYEVQRVAQQFDTLGADDARVRTMDRLSRLLLRKNYSDGIQRVLFVVPSEPLVWQVGAYFTKLLRDEGETIGRVGVTTNVMTFIPSVGFGVMPQIFVGTPMAIESQLAKCRGLIGRRETSNLANGVSAAGGFDHFDWAVYDEVHSLDGKEGEALQRLIRSMNCKFLALSATVGNAEELRGWLEKVKGEQIVGLESVTALPSEACFYAPMKPLPKDLLGDVQKQGKSNTREEKAKATKDIKVIVRHSVGGENREVTLEKMYDTTTVGILFEKVQRILLASNHRGVTKETILLRHAGSGELLKSKDVKIVTFAPPTEGDYKDVYVFELLEITACVSRSADASAASGAEPILIHNLSPLSCMMELKELLWEQLTAEERVCGNAGDLCLRLPFIEQVQEAVQSAVHVQNVSNSPVNNDVVLDAIMTATANPLIYQIDLQLDWLEIKVVRTLDFQRVNVTNVSPSANLMAVKERIVEKWPYFEAQSIQLICRYPIGEPLNIISSTAEFGYKFVTIQSDNTAELSERIVKGAVLIIGDDLIRVDDVYEGNDANTKRARVDHFDASLAMPITCTASQAVMAGDNKMPLWHYIPQFTKRVAQQANQYIHIEVRSLVNLLVHSARFINLQRYVWNGRLELVSPLAAIANGDLLKKGVLDQSTLSFTSRDSYQVWLALEKLYPLSAIQHLNPSAFFANDSRITLSRSKEYEDALKHHLKYLAENYPLETRELLHHFSLQDPPKIINLYDLVMALKQSEKLPALVFHLNTFEAIRIFKVLLAAIERKQKVAHPYYYTAKSSEWEAAIKQYEAQVAHKEKVKVDKKKGERGEDNDNNQQLDTDIPEPPSKVDVYEPHPKFTFSQLPCMTAQEYIELSDEMEKFDGFKARDRSAMNGAGKGQNKEILGHALMRGLRRGIGLFIDEVSAPSYRRAVQRLASLGKLAVVVSDDSLAFGVNMPFRTCVFCGEMDDALTPLMAQQMSGRAGRRGLDTEGNLVYTGATASFIRELMLGQVANITGKFYQPKYDTVFLQGILSGRHTGWNRVELLGGQTLNEFIEGAPKPAESYSLDYSKRLLVEMNIIQNVNGQYVPVQNYELLAMIWELRYDVPVSLCMAELLNELCEEIKAKTKELKTSTLDNESKEAKRERLNQYVAFMFTIFIQIFDRVEYTPQSPVSTPLQNHEFLKDPKKRAIVSKWSKLLRQQQSKLDRLSEALGVDCQHLKLPLPIVRDESLPETDDATTDPNYIQLDASLLQCMLPNKQLFVQALSDEQKQHLKDRIWRAGCTLRTIQNTLWPCNEYFDNICDVLHHCFRNLYYLNMELLRDHIKFDDVSAYDRELRIEKEHFSIADRPDLSDDPRVNPMVLWTDNNKVDTSVARPVLFAEAAALIVKRFFLDLQEKGLAYESIAEADRTKIVKRFAEAFSEMKPIYIPLIEFALHVNFLINSNKPTEEYIQTQLPKLLRKMTGLNGVQKVGIVYFISQSLFPRKLAAFFPKYLQFCSDESGLEEADITGWVALSTEETMQTFPSGCSFTEAQVTATKTSKAMEGLLQYLNLDEEEDDDDEEEEDDE